MKYIAILLVAITATFSNEVLAQSSVKDSAEVVKAFKELLYICQHVDFGDPLTQSKGTFYKAAPYIVYRGKDEKRAWKDVANYNNEEEKKGVNEVCYRINHDLSRAGSYEIVAFQTKKESEGIWYALFIQYKLKGVDKKAIYAFLKVKGRFALGDVD